MSNPVPVGPLWGLGQGGMPVVTPPSALAPGGRPQVTGLNMQIPLPEVFPIPDAHEFNPLGFRDSAAIETQEITDTVLLIPDGNIGIVRGVSLYITDMLTTTRVFWSLTIEGASPEGFNRITIFPRAAPFVNNNFDAAVRFTGPARISVLFNNVDGGTYTIGAAYSGWYWPTASDARWRRFGM